jgi:hypothetical protein
LHTLLFVVRVRSASCFWLLPGVLLPLASCCSSYVDTLRPEFVRPGQDGVETFKEVRQAVREEEVLS